MPSNRGVTSLRCRPRNEDKMREFDRLPTELRMWLASASLPWRPRSVQRTYARAFARTRNTEDALRALDQIERKLMSKDIRRVWGDDHPGVFVEVAE
ncbi:MAG: DUF6525 family protein [Pseudomonadota bacterium]